MNKQTQQIRDDIIDALLPGVPFDGWSWTAVRNAAEAAGYGKQMADAVFPGKLADVAKHFSDRTDRLMLEKLADIDPESLRVRDRIRMAVLIRLEILTPHKEAVRLVLSYWAMPFRGLRAGGVLWRTADRIWDWAGDTAKDYNRYTKRGLLCGVLASTMTAWIGEQGQGMEQTISFLDRRIENVMQLGRVIGKVKKAA